MLPIRRASYGLYPMLAAVLASCCLASSTMRRVSALSESSNWFSTTCGVCCVFFRRIALNNFRALTLLLFPFPEDIFMYERLGLGTPFFFGVPSTTEKGRRRSRHTPKKKTSNNGVYQKTQRLIIHKAWAG